MTRGQALFIRGSNEKGGHLSRLAAFSFLKA
jgi:hypothetical protein